MAGGRYSVVLVVPFPVTLLDAGCLPLGELLGGLIVVRCRLAFPGLVLPGRYIDVSGR